MDKEYCLSLEYTANAATTKLSATAARTCARARTHTHTHTQFAKREIQNGGEKQDPGPRRKMHI